MDSRFLSRRDVIMSLSLWDREKLGCDQKPDLWQWLGDDAKAPMAKEKCDIPTSVSFCTIEMLFCAILKRICAIHKMSILICHAVEFL